MRKLLLFWPVALFSVSSLAGCGLFGSNRNECSDGRCSVAYKRTASRTLIPGEIAKLEPVGNTEPVVIAKQSTPLVSDVIETVQEAPPASKQVEHSYFQKMDVTAQEEEIVRRETAAMRGKSVTRVVDELPSVPALPALEPAPSKAVAEPIAVIPEAAIPTAKQAVPEKDRTAANHNVDITYGQTDNFKSITGQVQQYRKTWRLRYADPGQEDPHGGVVVLEGGADLSKLREGCHVRVTGTLVPPTTRTGSATYRVQSIEILD